MAQGHSCYDCGKAAESLPMRSARWLLPPDAAEFWPKEAPKELVDLAGETAAASAACEMAGLGGQALRVQFGGRGRQARAQALKAKGCIVDDGDGTKKLSQAIDEALEEDNPDAAMARAMAATAPFRRDKDLGKWLKNAEEELGQTAAIAERSDTPLQTRPGGRVHQAGRE